MSVHAQRLKRREQRESTRRQILAAAAHLLRERPFRELTVDAVMADTGLTRTAFYRHFGDVTELVLALQSEVEVELEAVAKRWIEHAGEAPPGPARAGLLGTIEFFQRHGPMLRAIAEAAATDPEIELAYHHLLDVFVGLTVAGFERMGRPPGDHATFQLARALVLLNERYLLEQFGREPYGDPELALETLETIWVGAGLRFLGLSA